MKVMVVDDNEQNLYLLEVLLKSEKYEVVCARDGLDALEHLKKGSFGLIISDILMPRMDGFQLCRECKVDPHLKDIPFIFYTATYTDGKDEEFALSLGAERFVVKPMEPQGFLTTIREVIKENEKGALTAKKPLIKDEELYLVEYNKRLIQKLEKKMLDLEMAHKTLAESEKKYRTLVTQSPDGIFIVDLQGTFLAVNKSMCERLKYSEEEFLSMKIWDIVPEKYVDLHKKRLADILRGEAPNEAAEYVVRGKDEKMHYIEVLSNPYLRENELIGFQGIARDITDRKRAEEALSASEERYRTLFEGAAEGILVADIESRQFKYANPALCRMLGYTLEELMRLGVADIHPKEALNYAVAEFEAQASGEKTLVPDIPCLRKDSSIIYVRIATTPVVIDGRKCNVGFFTDITERKKAEEQIHKSETKYRKLHESMRDGFAFVSMDGMIKEFNESYRQMIGYTPEELLMLTYRDITPEKWHAFEQNIIEQQVLARGYSEVFEKEYLKRDGTIFPVELRTFLIKDETGGNIGMWAIIRDITERKQIEQEKANLEEQLRQSQKIEAIGRLAGGIAHDFNNLLTVIKGYSQLSLIELKEGDPLKENIEEVKKAADRAADLTRQLLAFSRRQILEMKVLDLNTVLRDMDKMLHRLIGEDIELITLLADDLGRVKTDPGWVEQIIMNLAVNARDAMPSVGKLTIETANVELDEAYSRGHIAVKPGRYVMLSVSDTGIGMTPEVRQQVFEPFFTTKEKGKGTGLGLSTVYGIVKQSEGNIWVYSEPGEGTTFKIYLPRVDEPLEELREKVVKEELPRGSETILLVEDEEVVRKLAVRVLKRQGYTVLEGSHGNEAIDVCKQHKGPIHLLLTDVVMPKMSGRELAERFKPLYPKMKVLYMSGYTDNAITHHGVLEEGMNYIQKPFTLEGLARKVRRVLDK